MAFIKGKQLIDNAIIEAKIADSAVTNAKLAGSIPATKLDLSGSFNFLSAGGTVTVAAPTLANHAATKGYVDGIKQSLDIKESVRVATTAELATSYANNVLTADANGAISIDGVALSQNDRVLVKNQGDTNESATENGIYVVTTVGDASNAFVLTRASDFDSSDDITAGAFCFVTEGTANGDVGFVLSTDDAITLDTTALSFIQFSSAGQITAGDGIAKNGATISVDLDSDSGLAVAATGLKVDASTLADGAVAVADDQIVFIDNDGGTKRESVADFATALAGGNGITSTSGVLSADLLGSGGLAFSAGEITVLKDGTSLSSSASGLKVNLNSNNSIAIKGGAGLASAIPDGSDIGQTPSAVSANATSTGLTITNQPVGLVRILVNGVQAELGDGVLNKDCYFSSDGGTTPKGFTAIASGDTLFWNGGNAGSYALETSDLVDFIYVSV